MFDDARHGLSTLEMHMGPSVVDLACLLDLSCLLLKMDSKMGSKRQRMDLCCSKKGGQQIARVCGAPVGIIMGTVRRTTGLLPSTGEASRVLWQCTNEYHDG